LFFNYPWKVGQFDHIHFLQLVQFHLSEFLPFISTTFRIFISSTRSHSTTSFCITKSPNEVRAMGHTWIQFIHGGSSSYGITFIVKSIWFGYNDFILWITIAPIFHNTHPLVSNTNNDVTFNHHMFDFIPRVWFHWFTLSILCNWLNPSITMHPPNL
jgi:hypothetical protein